MTPLFSASWFHGVRFCQRACISIRKLGMCILRFGVHGLFPYWAHDIACHVPILLLCVFHELLVLLQYCFFVVPVILPHSSPDHQFVNRVECHSNGIAFKLLHIFCCRTKLREWDAFVRPESETCEACDVLHLPNQITDIMDLVHTEPLFNCIVLDPT